jgi:ubiquitin-like protein Pup
MAKRIHKEKSKQDAATAPAVEADTSPAAREDAEAITNDIDDLLDEIDSVLEQNAEEFVQAYVQKGGE